MDKTNREIDIIELTVLPGTLKDKREACWHGGNLIYLLCTGSHGVHLGADYHWLQANDLVVVPENFRYTSTYLRSCRGYCIQFRTAFIQPLLNGNIAEDFPCFDLEAEHVVHLTAPQSNLLKACFKDIQKEYKRFSSEKEELLRSFVHILLLRIRSIYHPGAKIISENTTSALKLANGFKHLVERNFIEVQEVKKYAEMLHITTRYLTAVVKKIMGKPPRDIIKDRRLLEAKILLGTAAKSITEIAYLLNFSDQAHFCHFIKQHTGYTPHQLQGKY